MRYVARSAVLLRAPFLNSAALLYTTLGEGAVSLCATLRGCAASLGVTSHAFTVLLCSTLRGGVALLGAALSLGRRDTITWASHNGGLVSSLGATLGKCMKPLSSHDEGAVPLSHNEGAVPFLVSYGSAKLLALYVCGAVVVVVVGVAVDAVTGVAKTAGWGWWWGSLCSSLCMV